MTERKLKSPGEEMPGLNILLRADEPEKARLGMKKGAQGIGLIRGEALLRSNGPMREVYTEWLKSRESEDRRPLRERLVSLWTEEWAIMLQAAAGTSVAASLAWDVLDSCGPGERMELQDIQLESMFRAASRVQEEGTECRLEVLALWPMEALEFAAASDFVEGVGGQMMDALQREVKLSVGALLHPDIGPAEAGEIARQADLIVLDTEIQSSFALLNCRLCSDNTALAGDSSYHDPDAEPVTEWACPALRHVNLAEAVRQIRRVKPHIPIRIGGEINASDLKVINRLGITEVCCAPEDLASIRQAEKRVFIEEGMCSAAKKT